MPVSLPRRAFTSDFPVEWSTIAATALIDAAWARAIDFHLVPGWQSWAVIAVMTAAFLALRRWFPTRIALGAEYFILSLAGTAVLMVFSYLCMASAQGPLIDQMLLRGDRALGFDWLALHDRIMAHKPLAVAGRLLYQSLIIQGLYCTILLALMQQRTWMRELWRLTFIASVLCCLGGMLFPALGPYKIFHLESEGTFLPAMEHLLGHRSLVFAPSGMTGVICFPSLHTVMALAYAYGLRRTGPLFFIFAGLNTLMLFTIPFFGGHYLMDMLAGAGVMPVSVALMRLSFAAQAGMNARRVSVLVEKTA